MVRKLSVLRMVLALATAIFSALPLTAQTATPTPSPDSLVVVVGPVDLGQGVIMVNGYIIAPASAFEPSILHQGDEVIVIGYLLPDGATIHATSLEFFVEPTLTPTPNWTPTFTPTLNLTATLAPFPTATFTPTPNLTATATWLPIATSTNVACNQPGHPVAMRLAEAFGVPYEEIIGWHCAGFGFGEITRAYLLADATGLTPDTYFAQRNAGIGWGQIIREAGVHPSDLAPGQVIRRNNGHGNGNGNGNCGRGNGNGNGNPNCGGRGNGNGNGNGHGHG